MKSSLLKILPVFFLILFSCNTTEQKSRFEGYKQLGDKLFFKYEGLPSESVFPHEGDFLTLHLKYSFYPLDSVFFEGVRNFRLTIPENDNSIEHALFQLGKGDSASLIVDVRNFFEKDLDTTLPAFLDSVGWMFIRLKIIDIVPQQKFIEQVNQMMQWMQKIKPGSFLLDTFLNKLEWFEKRGGIVKILVDSGNGKKIDYGDTIFINYEGYFFDGKVFDSTYKSNRPLGFVYGTEKQVIKAFDIVLKNMEEKEKALYIIPPELAFGPKGVKGIIPPYEPVIFLLEVDSVKKNISL